jgi:hypothetical protein
MNVIGTFRDAVFKDYQNACLYNFQVLDSLDKSDEEVIMEFIKTDIFNKERAPNDPDWFNNSVWIGHNLPAFNFPLLTRDHFKQWDKSQLYHYLDTCTDDLPWDSSSIDTFRQEAYWVKNEIDKCQSDLFFFISMDWFDENGRFVYKANTNLSPVRLKLAAEYDPVLNNYAHIYGYYIAFFWLDREHAIITMCELSWD